jgi:hypothetical protein
MGYNTALDLSEELELDLEMAIGIHLRSNHYPPVPLSMVQPCIEAIDAYYDEDYRREITLPEGVLWRGQVTAPADAIIDQHHLSAWLPENEF